MCCSFCLNRGCVKVRDAETNTYCSDTDELQFIITDLQEKIEALENLCTELQEENTILKAAHKDFIIDHTPSFPEPSPPPLTPPPVQLKPPVTGSPDSDVGCQEPPDTGSSDGGDDGGRPRCVRPAQRRSRSTVRRRATKNKSKIQPSVKKTVTETAGTSAELQLSSGVSVGEKSVETRKKEKEVKERSPSPPHDVPGPSNEGDQNKAVNMKVGHLINDSGSDIQDMGEAAPEPEERDREEPLNATAEQKERLNATPEREGEDRLNSPCEGEERLNAPPERKVSKRRRPAVNYREEEDQDVDEPKSPSERKVTKRRRPAVNQKEETDKDAGSSVGLGTVQCPHCGVTYLEQDHLDRHVRWRHGYIGRNGRYKCGGTVQCHLCEFMCLGQDRLDRHVKQRHRHLGKSGRYKCIRCEYSTDKKYSITVHRRTHTGERPHRCDYCGKAFTRRDYLTTHILTHTGKRPCVCDVCGKTFTRADHLTVHKRIHTGETVRQCEQCGARFTNTSYYTTHMKAHNGVKEHRCQVCSARFVRRDALTRHARTHTGERPYTCSFCPARFIQQSNMKDHVTRRHTYDYQHRCCRCSKGFAKLGELRNHELKCSA